MTTITPTIEDTIKAKKLSWEFVGEAMAFDRKSFEFKIKLGGKTFSFYDSVHNFQSNKQDLTDDELMFAYYCIIGDAESYINTQEDKTEFLLEFGYLDYRTEYGANHLEQIMTDEEFQRYLNGVKAWKGCRASFRKLKMTHDELIAELDLLRELDIG